MMPGWRLRRFTLNLFSSIFTDKFQSPENTVKAIFTLNKLNSDEKNLLKMKQIKAEMPVQQWIDLFSKLRDFDKEADSSRAWAVGLAIAGGFIAFFGLFLLIVFVGFLMIPIGLIMLVGYIVAYFYLKPYDIQSEILTQRLLPMLLILREETKPNGNLKLRLDFRGFEVSEKLVSQSDKRNTSIYRSIIDYYYRDNWIDGDTTLADGTRLVWSITDLVKHVKKVKYRKGKQKSKSKFRTVLNTQIGMHRKRFLLPDVKENGNEGKIKTQKSGAYHWMQVRKTVKHLPPISFQPVDFLNTIASAYVRATPLGGRK
jgi:hypothetical protein